MARTFTGGVVVLLVALLSATAGAQTMTLEEVLILSVVERRPDDGAGHLFEADRGARKGQLVQVRTAKRPAAGAPAVAGGGSVSAGRGHVEYHLLGPATVRPLPDVDVLGVHYIKVRPDRREEFEQFAREKLHPAVGNLRPDLRLLYYKCVRGCDAGSYITVFALTRASRDKYWPGGSDSDDLRAAFMPLQGLAAELGTYLVEGSAVTDPKFAAAVYESREWTDFVLMPAAPR